jgi:hypothetical protein
VPALTLTLTAEGGGGVKQSFLHKKIENRMQNHENSNSRNPKKIVFNDIQHFQEMVKNRPNKSAKKLYTKAVLR